MAVTINTYFSERIIEGSRPSVPSVPSSEVPPVVNPPGYPSGHSPVTLASPSNGLTLVGQQLGLGLASSGVTGALSGADWDTFDEKIGGSIASGQVAFGAGAGAIGGDSGLTWDNVNKRLGVGSVSPAQSMDSSGNIRVGGTFIYGDTNTALIRLSNAFGAVLGYGNLSLINGGNAIIVTNSNNQCFRINSTGSTLIGASGNPTNTLDVNGTARIRTINNLGTSATVVLTKSATGVISERTLAELASDGLGSKWTSGTGFIYRDGPVVVGANTVADSETTFQVNSKSTSTSFPFIRIKANDGTTNLITVLNNGNTTFSGRLSLNGSGFGHDGLLVRAFSDSAASTIFGVQSTTGVNRFSINGLGNVNVVGRLLVNEAIAQDGFSLRSFSDSALSSIFQLFNSTGATNWFNVYGDGRVLINGNFQFTESRNIILGTTTGTKIGTANTQKLAFWNATPIVQPLETALANTPNTGDANTDALITALKNIILNTGLGRSA